MCEPDLACVSLTVVYRVYKVCYVHCFIVLVTNLAHMNTYTIFYALFTRQKPAKMALFRKRSGGSSGGFWGSNDPGGVTFFRPHKGNLLSDVIQTVSAIMCMLELLFKHLCHQVF